jgi:predicted nucleic acid-binding protein
VYWDTCIFLAWMNDERRPAGDMEGLGQIAELVERAEVVLITSTLTRAEILQSKTSKEAMKKYDALLRRSNVVPHNVDLPIARLTSELMDFYINSDFELLTPDAIHLATALHYSAHEFHTFDGSDAAKKPRRSKFTRCGLLKLDGNIAGRTMNVVRPSAAQFELSLPPLPLEGSFMLTPAEIPLEQGELPLRVNTESPKEDKVRSIRKITLPEDGEIK